ncbi:MAG: hypothetical protein CL885_04845, partial [Dehalococcoidia bacterium]|nr:hypothetical protein [Dehalococcoidia bacterium]
QIYKVVKTLTSDGVGPKARSVLTHATSDDVAPGTGWGVEADKLALRVSGVNHAAMSLRGFTDEEKEAFPYDYGPVDIPLV